MNKKLFRMVKIVCFIVFLLMVNICFSENSPITLKEDEKITITPEYRGICFYNKQNNESICSKWFEESDLCDSRTKWKVSLSLINKLWAQIRQKNVKDADIVYLWTDANNRTLGNIQGDSGKVTIDQANATSNNSQTDPQPQNQSSTPNNNEMTEEEAIETWQKDIIKNNMDKRFVSVLFDEFLNVHSINCFPNKYYSTVGDPIYAGVLTSNSESLTNLSFEFSPCSIIPEMPQLYASGKLNAGQLESNRRQTGYTVKSFGPRVCYNKSVVISVKKISNGNTLNGEHVLMQYNRYRVTLHLGVIFSENNDISFGLHEEGNKKVIYNKGPENKGPQYMTTIVIYSLPRYLNNLLSAKKNFVGRDIINENTILDRIGGVIGVGLSNPGKRFFAGLSFEIMFGLNIVGGLEFSRIRGLANDLKIGDEFAGKEEDIPLADHWRKKYVLGVSLDLRYVTALFQKE